MVPLLAFNATCALVRVVVAIQPLNHCRPASPHKHSRDSHQFAAAVQSLSYDQARAPLAQGSVLEGKGRKLTGTSAMRLRNTVLQQTGFLEQRATK